METLFLQLLNMSITASWLVLAVIVVRLLFKKAPKALICALWAIVAVRLLCPFSFESVVSLIPSAEPIPQEILYEPSPSIESGIPIVNETINPILSDNLSPSLGDSVNPMQVVTMIAAHLWILGIIVMLVYAVISYIRVWRKVRVRLPLEDRVFVCDTIDTPFIFGIIKPHIYLPSTLSEADRAYVLAHERAHLKRLDHIWKPLGFALLTVYWFNPLLWVAYILLCRDIELACDERVIRDMDKDDTAAYTEALLHCSTKQRFVTACPLAFGESGVKARIKNVLNYKKPAFWIVLLAVAACIVVTVCFLTDPIGGEEPIDTIGAGSELDGLSLVVETLDPTSDAPSITVRWQNDTEHELVYGESFRLYRLENGELIDTNLVKNSGFSAIGYMLAPHGNVPKSYSLSEYNLSQSGTYRFESHVNIQGGDATVYKVWVDFAVGADGLSPLITATDVYVIEDDTMYDDGLTYEIIYPVLKSETQDYEILNSFLEDNIEEKLYYLRKAYGPNSVVKLKYTVTYNDGTLISVLFEGTVTPPDGKAVNIAFTACLAPGNGYTVNPESLFTMDDTFLNTFRTKWLALWDDANLTAEKAQEIRNTIHAYSDDELAALLRSGDIANFGFTSNGVLVVFRGKPSIADYVLIEIPYATTTTTTTTPVIETRVNTELLSMIGKSYTEITASYGKLVQVYDQFDGGFPTYRLENSNGFFAFGWLPGANEDGKPYPRDEKGNLLVEAAPIPDDGEPCSGIWHLPAKELFLGLNKPVTAEQLAEMYGLKHTGSAPADRTISGHNHCDFDFEGLHFTVYAEEDFTIGPDSIVSLIKVKTSTTTTTTTTATTTTTTTTTAMTTTTRATTAPTVTTTATTVATTTTTTTREYYTVTFMHQGRELAYHQLRVGEKISVPDPVDDTWYVWDAIVPDIMPAKDLQFELVGAAGEYWQYDLNGTLIITQSTPRYSSEHVFPWAKYNDDITKVTFTNNVYRIEDYTFYGMKSLKQLDFPDNLIRIGRYAFAECTNLKIISFGKNLESIGKEAFSGTDLRSVLFQGGTHWYASKIGYGGAPVTFSNDPTLNAKTLTNLHEYSFTLEE